VHERERVTESAQCRAPAPPIIGEVTERLHPKLERDVVRLARAGVGAAEIRRRLIPAAERLGVARPGYTAVRELVAEVRADRVYEHWEPTASPLDSLAKGRMPTPYELEQVRERRLRNRLVN
jgi:hypothetical protein